MIDLEQLFYIYKDFMNCRISALSMNLVFRLSLILTIALLSACVYTFAPETKENLSKRASFDMSCPAQDLKFTVLSTRHDLLAGDNALSVGVEGCGKKLVYVDSPTSGWLANSYDQQK